MNGPALGLIGSGVVLLGGLLQVLFPSVFARMLIFVGMLILAGSLFITAGAGQ